MAVLISLSASLALVAHTFLATDGWSRRLRAHRDLTVLEADIAASELVAQSLRKQVDGLRTRTEVQEWVVRDELGYVRAGDVVLDLGRIMAKR